MTASPESPVTQPLRAGEQRQLRCVHVITGLAVGGAERMLQKLVLATQGRELANEVICLSAPGPVGDELEAAGVPVAYLRMSAVMPSLSRILRLRRMLRSGRADVVQTWMYHANLLGGLALAGSAEPPVVWNVRASNLTSDEKLATRMIARGSGFLARALCRRVVINSHNALHHHVALGYPADLFEVIPNGFDVDTFHPDPVARVDVRTELHVPVDAILIGIAARLHAMKGYPIFLDAAEQLATRRPGVHFVLIGKGVDADFAQGVAVARPALSGRLHGLGPRRDIPRLLAALDIYTSTSLYGEGFPNVLGEAMACGVPCVATDVGDSARIIGDTGIIVPINDPSAVVSGWTQLLEESPPEHERRRARSHDRVDQEYRLERIVSKYVELYRGLSAAIAE